ncbi:MULTISPECIES: hypothetical protein [Roseinatronobacter]|uniref:YARHG domain-containing protein n=1 Tax=Roseinatronobacter domitianus TaxID=2940293 RepID=A0ABT0LYL7_9RHOB|nr:MULTISPECIES: hypothetical protein [Roseibaca]MCL1627681.1 hypothetical protein [Roseibaca domitiana]
MSRLLLPFTVLMIGLGLWQVGGPEQARSEQRDAQRLNDLRALAAYLTCEKMRKGGADFICGTYPRDTDRFTQQPFTVTQTQVCAEFEQSDRTAHRFPDEVENGCIRLD